MYCPSRSASQVVPLWMNTPNGSLREVAVLYGEVAAHAVIAGEVVQAPLV